MVCRQARLSCPSLCFSSLSLLPRRSFSGLVIVDLGVDIVSQQI